MGVLTAGWVIVPLVARRIGLVTDAIPASVVDAEARRRVALASLKEVEYDRVSGKLDETDYLQLKAQLEREALAAIAAADASTGKDEAPAVMLAELPITHSCGFVNPAGSRFCSGCGRRLA